MKSILAAFALEGVPVMSPESVMLRPLGSFFFAVHVNGGVPRATSWQMYSSP